MLGIQTNLNQSNIDSNLAIQLVIAPIFETTDNDCNSLILLDAETQMVKVELIYCRKFSLLIYLVGTYVLILNHKISGSTFMCSSVWCRVYRQLDFENQTDTEIKAQPSRD